MSECNKVLHSKGLPAPRTCAKCGLGPCRDGSVMLSEVSGIDRKEVLDLWAEVRANRARLDACSRHRFSVETVKLGQKLVCDACGGQMSLIDVGNYIRGYQAAGASASDIWPAYDRQ